jgi:hypothetical protein
MTTPARRTVYPLPGEYVDIASAALAAPVDNLVQSAALALDLFARMNGMGVFGLSLNWPIDVDNRVQGLARLVREATEGALAGQLTLGQLARRERLTNHVTTAAQAVIDAKAAADPSTDPDLNGEVAHQLASLLKTLVEYVDVLPDRVLGRMDDAADALADRTDQQAVQA